MSKAVFKPLTLVTALSFTALLSFTSNATIVEFHITKGNEDLTFKVNLHDQTTPETVKNFLNYVNNGDYNNTVVHRLIPNFIMQAGGFSFEGELPLTPIEVYDKVTNEPIYSNIKGTIAMAKPGSDANGARSQWFVNYRDNSANLDVQNGGFTVFGEVIEDGMNVINAMAAVPICGEIPMPDFTTEQCGPPAFVPGVENFITINNVTIFDDSPTSDSSLVSVKNTLINQEESSGSSGGSLSYFALCALAAFGFRRKTKAS